SRAKEAPSPQLSAMLRAADAAAAEAEPRQRRAPTLSRSTEDAPRVAERRAPVLRPAPLPEMEEEDYDDAPAPQVVQRVQPAPPPARKPTRVAPVVPEVEKFQLPPLDFLVSPPARRNDGPTEEALQGNARLRSEE